MTLLLLSRRSHSPCHHARGDTGDGSRAGARAFRVTTRVVTTALPAPSVPVATPQERFSWGFGGRGRYSPTFPHREALLDAPFGAILRPEAGPSVVTRPSMPAVDFVAICHHVAGGRGRGDKRLPISPDVCHHDRGDMVQLAWWGSCHHGGFPSWKGLNAGPWRQRGDGGPGDQLVAAEPPSPRAWRRGAKTRVPPHRHRRGKCISTDILPRGDDRRRSQGCLCHHGRGDNGRCRRSLRRHHGRGDNRSTAAFTFCHHGG